MLAVKRMPWKVASAIPNDVDHLCTAVELILDESSFVEGIVVFLVAPLLSILCAISSRFSFTKFFESCRLP